MQAGNGHDLRVEIRVGGRGELSGGGRHTQTHAREQVINERERERKIKQEVDGDSIRGREGRGLIWLVVDRGRNYHSGVVWQLTIDSMGSYGVPLSKSRRYNSRRFPRQLWSDRRIILLCAGP